MPNLFDTDTESHTGDEKTMSAFIVISQALELLIDRFPSLPPADAESVVESVFVDIVTVTAASSKI